MSGPFRGSRASKRDWGSGRGRAAGPGRAGPPPATPKGDRLDVRRGPDRCRAPFAFRGRRSAIGVRGVGGRRNRLGGGGRGGRARGGDPARGRAGGQLLRYGTDLRRRRVRAPTGPRAQGDRKSTRLNSSHSQISYAVFCLKKKK